jgi:hypothetical protein
MVVVLMKVVVARTRPRQVAAGGGQEWCLPALSMLHFGNNLVHREDTNRKGDGQS